MSPNEEKIQKLTKFLEISNARCSFLDGKVQFQAALIEELFEEKRALEAEVVALEAKLAPSAMTAGHIKELVQALESGNYKTNIPEQECKCAGICSCLPHGEPEIGDIIQKRHGHTQWEVADLIRERCMNGEVYISLIAGNGSVNSVTLVGYNQREGGQRRWINLTKGEKL